ncbi:MAG: DUF4239 domain-containing protein [Amaricoccus sp.]
MNFLTTSPLWVSGLIFGVILPALSMVGPFMVRRWVGLAWLQANNEVAGFKFAVVGVLYAVLLAFVVIVVWEKFSDAENTVAMEAGAVATVYRLSPGLGVTSASAVTKSMTDYLDAAIQYDWPAMAAGGEDPTTNGALNAAYGVVLAGVPADARASAALAAILDQLDQITQARRARIVLASGIVPDIVWLVLFAGAFVTVGFTYFFGAENLKAQTLMTGGLSLLIFAGLLIIIAIDHPFGGTVHVTSEPLGEVLLDFARVQR